MLQSSDYVLHTRMILSQLVAVEAVEVVGYPVILRPWVALQKSKLVLLHPYRDQPVALDNGVLLAQNTCYFAVPGVVVAVHNESWMILSVVDSLIHVALSLFYF